MHKTAAVVLTYCWTLSVLLMAGMNAVATEGVTSNQPFRVQVRELAVRSEPRPLAEVTSSLTYRTEVRITATNGDWYRIGDAGWVHRTGISQRSLESSTGSVAEFTVIVDGIVGYLTNGVRNGQTNGVATIQPSSGRSVPSPVPDSGN